MQNRGKIFMNYAKGKILQNFYGKVKNLQNFLEIMKIQNFFATETKILQNFYGNYEKQNFP